MASKPVYGPKEIQALLKRATELQKQQSSKPEVGLSLEEVEQIAIDSGIDPAVIRQAIAEQAIGVSEDKKFHILGGPLSLQIGREMPFKLSEDEWELVVQEARKTFNKSGGTVQKLGKSLEWMSPDSKFMNASLTATPSKDATRFFISTHYGKIAFLTYYISFAISMMGIGGWLGSADLSTGLTLTILAGSVFGIFSGVRFIFGKWVQSQRNRLENMFNRFERIISTDENESSRDSVKSSGPSIIIPEEEKTNNTSTSGKAKSRS